MPELPEIVHYKKHADATALHKKVTGIHFPNPSLLQAPRTKFTKALEGNAFSETRQFGKYLFLRSGPKNWLVFHFGMTGKLEYYQKQEDPPYSSMILCFEDASRLAFVCRRKLGKIFLTEGIKEFQEEQKLGPDALDFKKESFRDLLQKKKGSIKGALTDQHAIAGIGNVYADEILYQCRLHPRTKVRKLTPDQQEGLFTQTQEVLHTIIEKEESRDKLPGDYLTPHRKEGTDCPNCDGKVERIKISGRSTYFCPSCQKEES